MDKNRLEQKIKDELTNHQVPIDKEALWNNIHKKKKNRGLFFWLSGLMLIAGMGATILFQQTKNHEWVKAEPITEHKDLNENGTNQSQINASQLENENTKDADKNEDPTNPAKLLQTKKLLNNQEIQNGHQQAHNQEISIQTKNPSAPSLNQESNSSNFKNTNGLNTQTNKTTFPIPLNKTKLPFKEHNASATTIDKVKEEDFAISLKQVSSIASLPINFLTLNSFSEFPPIKFSPVNIENRKVEKSKNVKGFYFELLGGYALINKKMSSETATDLLEARENMETPLEQINLGFNLRHQIKAGFYLQSGLIWSRLSESNNYKELASETKLEGGHVILEITQPNSDVLFQTGEALVTYDTIRTYEVYNTYDKWDLPIGLGYQKSFGKWCIEGDVNFVLNLNHTFKGYLINEELDKLRKGNPFAKRIGLRTFASIGAGYEFNKKLTLWLKPNFDLNPWKVNVPESLIEQTYQNYGLQVYARLKI